MRTDRGLRRYRRAGWATAGFVAVFMATAWASRAPARAPQMPGEASGSVARGEYLANNVAMCVQCHSGRDAAGHILESEKFRGGVIPFKAPFPGEAWAFRAPAIAGLPGFTDEQIVALLTEGHATGRTPPKRPMPPFRMTREDAASIVAYLRSR